MNCHHFILANWLIKRTIKAQKYVICEQKIRTRTSWLKPPNSMFNINPTLGIYNSKMLLTWCIIKFSDIHTVLFFFFLDFKHISVIFLDLFLSRIMDTGFYQFVFTSVYVFSVYRCSVFSKIATFPFYTLCMQGARDKSEIKGHASLGLTLCNPLLSLVKVLFQIFCTVLLV